MIAEGGSCAWFVGCLHEGSLAGWRNHASVLCMVLSVAFSFSSARLEEW